MEDGGAIWETLSNFAFRVLMFQGEKDLNEFRGKDSVHNKLNTRSILKKKWQNLVNRYKGRREDKEEPNGSAQFSGSYGCQEVIHINRNRETGTRRRK